MKICNQFVTAPISIDCVQFRGKLMVNFAIVPTRNTPQIRILIIEFVAEFFILEDLSVIDSFLTITAATACGHKY